MVPTPHWLIPWGHVAWLGCRLELGSNYPPPTRRLPPPPPSLPRSSSYANNPPLLYVISCASCKYVSRYRTNLPHEITPGVLDAGGVGSSPTSVTGLNRKRPMHQQQHRRTENKVEVDPTDTTTTTAATTTITPADFRQGYDRKLFSRGVCHSPRTSNAPPLHNDHWPR